MAFDQIYTKKLIFQYIPTVSARFTVFKRYRNTFQKKMKKNEKIEKRVLTRCFAYGIISHVARETNKRHDKPSHFGGIAQLGEHLPYKQEVIGSSPIAPTIKYG